MWTRLTSTRNRSFLDQQNKPRVIRFENRHKEDVLGGKGAKILNHNNQTFWNHEIMRLKPEYLQIANTGGNDDPKKQMARRIIDGVRRAGGEFYNKITGEGSESGVVLFELMKQERAIEKTMQKLREDGPTIRSELALQQSSSSPPSAPPTPELLQLHQQQENQEHGGGSTNNSSMTVEPLSRTESTPRQDQRAGEPGSHDSNRHCHQEGRTRNHNHADDFSFRQLVQPSLGEINPSHPIVDPSLLAAASSNNDQIIVVDRSQLGRLLRSHEQQREKMCLLIGNFMKLREVLESVTQSTDGFRRFLESDILPKEALGRERQALEERYIEQERELENLRSKQNELEALYDAQKKEIADLKARLHGSNGDSCSSSSPRMDE